MLRFLISLIVIALSGFIQSASWFSIAGVKPNLVLVLTLVFFALLERGWVERLAIALTAELSIQFAPLPDIYGIVFLFVVIVCGIAMDYLRLQPILVLTGLVIVSTVTLNVIGSVQFVIALEEVIYNLVLVWIIYLAIEFLYGKKILTR